MARTDFLWRFGVALAVVGSITLSVPSYLRHQAGIVMLEATVPLEIPLAAPAEAPDLAALLAAAPFGRTAAASVVAETTNSTRPQLILRGIIAASREGSTALLDVDGIEGLYRSGAEVTASLTVTQVARDFVELQDDEGRITLRFDEMIATAKSDSVPDGSDAPSLLARMGQGLVVPARHEGSGPPETTAEYIDYWRHRIKKNPQVVLDEIGLTPTDQGYVIADRHDIGVRLAGLRSGDLVRSVNGQAVGDPDEDSRFYDTIAAAGHARLEVERGGKILSFSFPLR